MERREKKKTKKIRKQSEPLGKSYRKYFHDILSEFCLDGVTMSRYQIWWLSYENMVGIYGRGTYSSAMNSKRGRYAKQMKVVEVFLRRKKMPTGKENRKCQKDQILKY